MDITTLMVYSIAILAIFFFIYMVVDIRKNKHNLGKGSLFSGIIIGFITDFLDALGIGSFAPTTSLLRATKTADDENIPGTLNIAHAVPVMTEAFLFIAFVTVETKTLVLMIAAAVAGAYLGAGIISKMDRTKIQFVMGVALAVTACLMLLQQFGYLSGGTGTATGLSGLPLLIGCIGNFILGALMTAGIGIFAPCMALIAMLGLSPDVAFPIMMGSCAFLQPIAGVKYIKAGRYERKMSLGITLGGIVGVLVAVFIFGSIPLETLTWLVIMVIIYTSITLLLTYKKSRSAKLA